MIRISYRVSRSFVEFLTKKIELGQVPSEHFEWVMKVVFFGDHPQAVSSEGTKNKYFINQSVVDWLVSLSGEISNIEILEDIAQIKSAFTLKKEKEKIIN